MEAGEAEHESDIIEELHDISFHVYGSDRSGWNTFLKVQLCNKEFTIRGRKNYRRSEEAYMAAVSLMNNMSLVLDGQPCLPRPEAKA